MARLKWDDLKESDWRRWSWWNWPKYGHLLRVTLCTYYPVRRSHTALLLRCYCSNLSENRMMLAITILLSTVRYKWKGVEKRCINAADIFSAADARLIVTCRLPSSLSEKTPAAFMYRFSTPFHLYLLEEFWNWNVHPWAHYGAHKVWKLISYCKQEGFKFALQSELGI